MEYYTGDGNSAGRWRDEKVQEEKERDKEEGVVEVKGLEEVRDRFSLCMPLIIAFLQIILVLPNSLPFA